MVAAVLRITCWLLLALSLVLGSATAQAQGAPLPPVELKACACAGAPLEQVLPALRVELRERLSEGEALTSYRMYARCEDGVLTVRVKSPDGTDHSFETRLQGTDDDVRARVVALAIAEIVRDLPAPISAPAPEKAPEPARMEPKANMVREHAAGTQAKQPLFELGAFARVSLFSHNGTWLPGGGLTMAYRVGSLVLSVDGALLSKHEDVDLGSARTRVGYAEPALAYARVFRHAEARLGAAFALGRVRLDGHAEHALDHDGTLRTPYLVPSAFALFAARVAGPLAPFLKLQGGYVLVAAVGELPGAKDPQIRGFCTSVSLGASYAFDRTLP
jgi:hypothetical protein